MYKSRNSRVYVLIPTHNRCDILCSTLAQVRSQLPEELADIIVVDAGSTDDTRHTLLQHFPSVEILEAHASMWWTATVNHGLKYIMKAAGPGDHILLMNDDIELSHDALIRLLEASKIERLAIIGATNLIKRSGEPPLVYFCGGQYDLLFARHKVKVPVYSPWVSPKTRFIESDFLYGRLLLIPVKAFDSGRFFDEETFPQYLADEDFTYGAKSIGLKVLIDTKSFVFVNETTTAKFSLNLVKSGLHGVFSALTAFNSYYNWRQAWAFASRYARWPTMYFLCRYAIQFFNDNLPRR